MSTMKMKIGQAFGTDYAERFYKVVETMDPEFGNKPKTFEIEETNEVRSESSDSNDSAGWKSSFDGIDSDVNTFVNNIKSDYKNVITDRVFALKIINVVFIWKAILPFGLRFFPITKDERKIVDSVLN